MVDLEHSEPRVRIAIGEGIEPGAQDDELAKAVPHGVGHRLFREQAARGDERPHAAPRLRLLRFELAFEFGAAFLSENRDRQRVREHDRLIENLMRRPIRGSPEGGAGRGRGVQGPC